VRPAVFAAKEEHTILRDLCRKPGAKEQAEMGGKKQGPA